VSIDWLMDLKVGLVLVSANTIPVLAARVLGSRLATPVDFNHCLADGRPVFGPHKTWRGVISGTVAAALVGSAAGLPAAIAATMGVLALMGDLASSFAKRRSGKTSGAWVPGLDQLPEVLLPLLALKPLLPITWADVLLIAALFGTFGAYTSRLNDTIARRD